MSDNLIKEIAFDVIAVTCIWGLLNNPYLANAYHYKFYINSNHYYVIYSPVYSMMLGIGVSTAVLVKHL